MPRESRCVSPEVEKSAACPRNQGKREREEADDMGGTCGPW